MSVLVKRAFVGGAVSAIVMGAGAFILGEVSGYEARALLSSSLAGINMLCNTIILGASTILALMLTLLSLSKAAETKLTKAYYSHVLMVARTDTILIIITVITFLLLNLPITESKELPASWFSIIYYISLAMAAILGGIFIAVVTMLYGTIVNVIEIVGLQVKDHPLVDNSEEQEDLDKKKQRARKEIEDS